MPSEGIWVIPCGCTVLLCESIVLNAHAACRAHGIVLNFSDVSRISDISIQAYLRNVSPGQKNVPTIQEDGSEPSNAEMGNSDLALGGVRFIPDLESIVSLAEFWSSLDNINARLVATDG